MRGFASKRWQPPHGRWRMGDGGRGVVNKHSAQHAVPASTHCAHITMARHHFLRGARSSTGSTGASPVFCLKTLERIASVSDHQEPATQQQHELHLREHELLTQQTAHLAEQSGWSGRLAESQPRTRRTLRYKYCRTLYGCTAERTMHIHLNVTMMIVDGGDLFFCIFGTNCICS